MRSGSYLLIIFIVLASNYAKAQNVFKHSGFASFYADNFEGKETASGEKYKASKLTAAHLLLPFGTKVKVTNLENGKSVIVEINDRGPYVEGRMIDLSKAAAEELGFIQKGITEVEIEVVEVNSELEVGKSTNKRANVDLPERKKEFYEVHATKYAPEGFGVQIGTFKELVNMMQTTHNLKSAYKKKVIVEVVDVNNVLVYKVIIGHIKSRKKADELKETLKNDYPDCFVYEFK